MADYNCLFSMVSADVLFKNSRSERRFYDKEPWSGIRIFNVIKQHHMRVSAIFALLLFYATVSFSQSPVIGIKCGKLLDTHTGRWLSNQVIVVKGNKIDSILP